MQFDMMEGEQMVQDMVCVYNKREEQFHMIVRVGTYPFQGTYMPTVPVLVQRSACGCISGKQQCVGCCSE